MNDLESVVARLPLRSAPAEWRGEILRAARIATAEPAPPSQWRLWLSPPRLALAAAWMVIIALHISTTAESSTASPADIAQLQVRVSAQLTLLAELLDPPQPPPALIPRDAMLSRRESHVV